MITGPEGAVCEIDLCDHHGAPVANAYALGRAVSTRPRRRAPRLRGTDRSSNAPAPTPVRAEPQWR